MHEPPPTAVSITEAFPEMRLTVAHRRLLLSMLARVKKQKIQKSVHRVQCTDFANCSAVWCVPSHDTAHVCYSSSSRITRHARLVDLLHLRRLLVGALHLLQRQVVVTGVIIVVDAQAELDHAVDATSELGR